MRRIIIAAALALGGCTTNPTTGAVTIDPAIVQQIATYTAAVCAFEPAADQIIAVIEAFYPAGVLPLGVATTIGDQICKSPVVAPAGPAGSRHARRFARLLHGAAIVRIVQTPSGPVRIVGTTP